MENTINFKKSPILKWGFLGAMGAAGGLILFVIALLLFGSLFRGNSLSENIMQLFPVLTGIIGGAVGGLSFGILQHFLNPSGWKTYLTVGLGIFIYLIIIWMCLILGFSAIGQWD